MKKYILSIFALCFAIFAMGQEVDQKPSPWSCSGVIGLNASATGLVNWSAGGNNNLNGVAFGKVRLLYSGDHLSWETNLNLEYGLSYIDQEYDPFQKSSDVIDFKTKFGWQFHKAWYLTVSGGFKSQFDLGRAYNGTEAEDPIVSKFLSPSYTDISVGIDWKPNSIFSVYLSPVAGRLTSVYVSEAFAEKSAKNGQTNLEKELKETYAVWKYDVDEKTGEVVKNYDSNLRGKLGLSIKGAINYTYKDLKIITSIGLYTPYAWDKTKIYKDADGKLHADQENGKDFTGMKFQGYQDNNQRFGNFDVDWDASISYQFLKCLNVTLSTSLKYYNGVKIEKFDDDGISLGAAERVQFKGTLGLGVGYSF